MLAAGLVAVAPATADDLDDRQSALEQEAHEVGEAMESLDASITRSIAQLRVYQKQLPGARTALADAQARVATAVRDVESQSARLTLAEQSKADLDRQLQGDREAAEKTRRAIGAIAAQAYKNGGLSSNVSLMLGSGSSADLSDSIRLADAALRSQSTVLSTWTQQQATDQNAAARLAAVEEEISRLKARAESALDAEQAARDAAAARKAAVDRLVADSATLTGQLQAKKPEISRRLARVEADQAQVRNQIAERQRRELEAARQRAAAEAAARAAAEAAARQRAAAAAAAASAVLPPAPVVSTPDPAPPSSSGFIHPVPAGVPITSPYGLRPVPEGTIDFLGTGSYLHTGLDFGAACGTPLLAPADGEVMFADGAVPTGGNRIVLTHGVIGGNAVSTMYYHLTSSVVHPGQRVKQGQTIGYTGTTGNSTGCHLHFEVMVNGSLVDPAPYL
ncbi:hypothetical protein GCM10011512_12580 [Tersicoccus solisilvae]|uniref:M23ase beta-sheet core domain-containing protein n=1 Tax=Tersicoccus solisilvae TaxID=1882339 RepID=A0ABQ1NY61_9MICC|nr:hypothetical protein GCM10011512_12580 [Tersicoccus solisilvae]